MRLLAQSGDFTSLVAPAPTIFHPASGAAGWLPGAATAWLDILAGCTGIQPLTIAVNALSFVPVKRGQAIVMLLGQYRCRL